MVSQTENNPARIVDSAEKNIEGNRILNSDLDKLINEGLSEKVKLE